MSRTKRKPRHTPARANAGGVVYSSLPAEHWYQIRAAAQGTAPGIEIFIYGYMGEWGYSAQDFIRDLAAVDDGTSPVTVAFNTEGGDMFDGIAIHNALRRLGERCTARVDALAASAGSVAACGAHRVVMASSSMMMIHNPWTFAGGEAEDFRRIADALDKMVGALIAAYRVKAPGLSDERLRELLNAETWLTAAEAQELGLCDEIAEGIDVRACARNLGSLSRWRDTPAELLAMVADEDEAPPADPAPEPEPEPKSNAALALLVTAECRRAGIECMTEAVTRLSDLESHERVTAEVRRAGKIRDLCVAARLPDRAVDLYGRGLDEDGARAALFSALVGSGTGFEIHNGGSYEPEDAPSVSGPDGNAIYAARRAAQECARRGR